MKTLTTFIWGLCSLFLGSTVVIMHKKLDNFWDYFYVVAGLIALFYGANKINKSTD